MTPNKGSEIKSWPISPEDTSRSNMPDQAYSKRGLVKLQKSEDKVVWELHKGI
jgi:hypothetical protein